MHNMADSVMMMATHQCHYEYCHLKTDKLWPSQLDFLGVSVLWLLKFFGMIALIY